jgi:hypothetical protein
VLNLDRWAFAFTLLLVSSCFSGIHLPSLRGRSWQAYHRQISTALCLEK